MKNLLIVMALVACSFLGASNQTAGGVPQAGTEKSAQLSAEAQADADLLTVKGVVRGIIAADNAADLDAVARLYADDAIWLPPHSEPVRSKSEILSRYQKTFEQYVPQLSFRSDETHVCGHWAFDRGTTSGKLVPKDGRQAVPINDEYLMILQRSSGGSWRIALLAWGPAQ